MPSTNTRVLLGDMTWPEVRVAVQDGRVVIIPLGSTEQHGLHLPLDTDTNSVLEISKQVASRTGAVVTPPLSFGWSSRWCNYPGTLTLTPSTFQAVLADLIRSVLASGFKKIFLLNGHRPNIALIEVTVMKIMDEYASKEKFAIAYANYWDPALSSLDQLRKGQKGSFGHACEAETSIQLALRKDLVRTEKIGETKHRLQLWDWTYTRPAVAMWQGWPHPETDDGVMGDPTVASVESGENFIKAIVNETSRIVSLMSQDKLDELNKYLIFSNPRQDK